MFRFKVVESDDGLYMIVGRTCLFLRQSSLARLQTIYSCVLRLCLSFQRRVLGAQSRKISSQGNIFPIQSLLPFSSLLVLSAVVSCWMASLDWFFLPRSP